MDNRTLKIKIEKAASVYIKATGCKSKGDDRYEAYVSAYHYTDGVCAAKKAFKSTSSWLASERAYAVRDALVRMADALNVIITDDERNAVERAESANNTARMNLYHNTD